MELRIYLEFNQILKLIRKLPKEEIQRLITTLQSENELPRRKRTEYQPQKAKTRYAASGRGINPKEIKSGKSSQSLQKMILDAPTWTDAEFNDYKKDKAHLNFFCVRLRRENSLRHAALLRERRFCKHSLPEPLPEREAVEGRRRFLDYSMRFILIIK